MKVALCVAFAVLLAEQAVGVKFTERLNNVASDIKYLSSDSQGVKISDVASGVSCLERAVSYDGEVTLVAESATSLCFIKNRAKGNCFTLAEDLVGPIFNYGYTGSFVYTAGSSVFTVDPTTETVTDLELTVQENTYMACYGKCYYYSADCSSVEKGHVCETVSGAVGGMIGGLTQSGRITLQRSATEISNGADTFTIPASYGDFVDWTIDSSRVVVRFQNTIVLLDYSLSLVSDIPGTSFSSDVSSVNIGGGSQIRVIGKVDGSIADLYLEEAVTFAPKSLITQGLPEEGYLIALPGTQFLGVTDGSLKVFEASFSSNADGSLTPSFTAAYVELVSGTSISPASCGPIVVEDGVLEVFNSRGIEWWAVCDAATDAECFSVTRKTINTNGEWITLFAAAAAAFLVIPTSMYAYKQRKICRTPESTAEPKPQVYYDSEKGIDYDPEHELYRAQYDNDAGKKNRKRSILED